MALYIRFEDVRLRLVGKVRFTDNIDDDDATRMPVALANALINEAESDVELDLSPRYYAPFQTDSGGSFGSLPQRPTRTILRTLCELKAVMRILDTDFGRGTAVNGEDYYTTTAKRYKDLLDRVMKTHENGFGYVYPPLPGLKLNYQNEAADDGFKGQVLHHSNHQSGDYAAEQINDPTETFWNVTLATLDGDRFG